MRLYFCAVVQCLILAGGIGSRIQSLTQSIPKSLVPIEKVPFLHYQLSQLRDNGIRKVVLCTGYKGEQIRDYVGDGRTWNLEVSFSEEGDRLLGTAGAIRLALEEGLLEQRFFVLYGDSFLPIDFKNVWQNFLNRNSSALMTVLRNNGKWDSSNVCYKDGKVLLYNKYYLGAKENFMEYIDYGLSILKREKLGAIPAGKKADLADYFHYLSKTGELSGYEVGERFYEIGSMGGLEAFKQYVRSQERQPSLN